VIGKRIGPYLIVEEIGDGGHAFVFKGMKGSEPVAIKMLKPSATSDPATEKRFLAEVDALKTLDHPNIVAFKDYLFLGGFHYLVMEFMDAGSTDHLIRLVGPIEARYAVPILNQVLQGIAHAHSLGYVHRDLKPNNLLLNRNGQAKITDFGIAKVLGGETVTNQGFVLGTTAYMAPEYLAHGRDSEQSDLYAIGVSFYEILSGRRPFEFGREDESVAAFARRIVHEQPVPLSRHRPVPPELERIVMTAIERDPRKRYKTADGLRADLAAAFPDFVQRPIQILHGRPRTDELQLRRHPRGARPLPPTTGAGAGLLERLGGLLRRRSRRASAANGARGDTRVETPNHAARVPYLDELHEPDQVAMTEASELSAFLSVVSGPDQGSRFGLRPISRLGRDLRFDIRPRDSEVSRQHAVITFDGTGFTLRDLNSSNGTFVNGERVEIERPLRHGDVIQIGTTKLRFEHR
jgi:serine/threonine-protein kinase